MEVIRPTEYVLGAFGAGPHVLALPGGQATSWVSGDVVLKPGGGPAHEWWGETLLELRFDDIRVSTPIATSDGAWVVDGWTATSFMAGSHPDLSQRSALLAVVEAGRAFHRAVRHLPRPSFLDSRDDRWAVADRVAWGEQDMTFGRELSDLAARLRPQEDPPGESQLVHGDLTGNVLFAPCLPPVVIDISPYWRPTSYAEGVIAADALCYHGADESILPLLGVPASAVARALLFRAATANALARNGSTAARLAEEAERLRRAASVIGV